MLINRIYTEFKPHFEYTYKTRVYSKKYGRRVVVAVVAVSTCVQEVFPNFCSFEIEMSLELIGREMAVMSRYTPQQADRS